MLLNRLSLLCASMGIFACASSPPPAKKVSAPVVAPVVVENDENAQEERRLVEPTEPAKPSASALLAMAPMMHLETPPFGYKSNVLAALAPKAAPPKLKRVKVEANDVIDDERWFADNQLSLPLYKMENARTQEAGTLPSEIAPALAGMRLSRAIDHGDHRIAIYSGRYVAVTKPDGTVMGVFDFVNWASGPKDKQSEARFSVQKVNWAQVHQDTLYVSTGHRGYAANSGGLNAFISALAMDSGKLIWQSAPLVANSVNFLLRGGWIISGYGFTAEPDFLFVLNMNSGATVDKIKLKSGPSYILEKDNRLFVRTYNKNYEFSIR